jgi:hypothetical protein
LLELQDIAPGPKDGGVSSEDSLQRAEALLERLERTRQELESTQDPDRAIEILSELAEIAKEVEAELARAKKEAG